MRQTAVCWPIGLYRLKVANNAMRLTYALPDSPQLSLSLSLSLASPPAAILRLVAASARLYNLPPVISDPPVSRLRAHRPRWPTTSSISRRLVDSLRWHQPRTSDDELDRLGPDRTGPARGQDRLHRSRSQYIWRAYPSIHILRNRTCTGAAILEGLHPEWTSQR